jgi:hypothetical protein
MTGIGGHRPVMRHYQTASLALLLSACATAPQRPVAPEQPPAARPPAEPGSLIGLSPQALVGRFGNPVLQIREGRSVKLQFRGPRCVLDAYLYPSGSSGALRVAHVDTRLPSGADTDQAACVFALGNRGI